MCTHSGHVSIYGDKWVSMDPWTHGSMNPYIHGSMNILVITPWIHEYPRGYPVDIPVHILWISSGYPRGYPVDFLWISFAICGYHVDIHVEP